MEIVKVQLGRAVWLFDTQELNPRGTALYPDLFIGFGKRYQFVTMPKTEEIQSGGSVYFKQGRFLYETTNVAVDFELHNDGLVANTRHSTEAANIFLQDVVDWCKDQLGVVYPPGLTKKRVYRSELIVNMSPDFDALAGNLRQFSALVSEATTKPSQVTGMQFGSQEIPSAFYVERKVNTVPLEDNHYIANAWLQTSQHLELLGRFEQLMTE